MAMHDKQFINQHIRRIKRIKIMQMNFFQNYLSDNLYWTGENDRHLQERLHLQVSCLSTNSGLNVDCIQRNYLSTSGCIIICPFVKYINIS